MSQVRVRVCVSRYTTQLVDSSLVSQAYNPELTVDTRKSNRLIDRQMLQLKLMTNKLRKAYGGFYVDWIDIGLSTAYFSISLYYCWSTATFAAYFYGCPAVPASYAGRRPFCFTAVV